MQVNSLLKQIWSNKIAARERDSKSPLTSILEVLLSVSVVSLVLDSNATPAYAMAEHTELMPGVTLGDVLYEELNIDVPRNAIVLVESTDQANAVSCESHVLGGALGRVLIDLVSAQNTSVPMFQSRVAELDPSGFALAKAAG